MIAANVTSLPPGDSPDLILVPATPEERIASIKLNSFEWKGPLDLDNYIARENHLYSQKLTCDGLTCWLLVDKSEPEGERTILSSCETYQKKALLAHKGTVEIVSTHGIGSVYCRPEFRGKGYAKRMFEELSVKVETWKMEKETRGRSLFTVLYSDIGKKFYSQFGWKPFLSSHLSLPPLAKQELSNGAAMKQSETKDLYAADVEKHICNEVVINKVKGQLRDASKTRPGSIIAIMPDYHHFLWHWAREEFVAGKLLPNRSSPAIKGAGNDSARVYCSWTRNFDDTPQGNVLYILRWVYDDPTSAEEERTLIDAMVAILRRAQQEAHDWNMSRVEFWNPTPLLQKAVSILDSDAQIVHREKSSIASLRWTGAEQGLGNDVEWFLNEKYAWC